MIWIWFVLGVVAAGGIAVGMRMRRRGLTRWIVPYCLQAFKRGLPRKDDKFHLILCIADHYEPKNGQATLEQAQARVERWVQEYPRQFGNFRDSDGRTPRHSFFYPLEEYDADCVESLAELCRAGFGEIEIHLHHDGDTGANLREQLVQFKEILAERHGMLARHRETGELAYGFIHGNWSLCNSRPDGRWCGVNEELDVLRQTGCYADFTMPSAPGVTQTRKINSLYYAVNQPGQPRSHETGIDVGAGRPPQNSLLLIQGPLVFDWRNRKFGVVPKLENSCLQGSQPPTWARVANWLRARVQVPRRPDWFFVKLHAHGAEDVSYHAMLGEPMVRFHRDLAENARRNPRFHYHYVTAREMYNLVKAAEAGWQGTVRDALDFELVPNFGASVESEATASVPADCGQAS